MSCKINALETKNWTNKQVTTHIIQLYCSISRNTHFFDRIACNVWWGFFIFSLSIMSTSEGFSFSMLKSFRDRTFKLLNEFLSIAKWISVRRLSDKICLLLSDQIDPAAAQDERDHSSKIQLCQACSLLHIHHFWKGANNFILQPRAEDSWVFHYQWTSMALGHN